MSTTLGELASIVRSKNAGPFWLTLDVFLPDGPSYERAAASPLTDPAVIAELFSVEERQVRVFCLPDLRAVKVSFPRPATQGSAADRDMHAGQQFVPLLDIEIE